MRPAYDGGPENTGALREVRVGFDGGTEFKKVVFRDFTIHEDYGVGDASRDGVDVELLTQDLERVVEHGRVWFFEFDGDMVRVEQWRTDIGRDGGRVAVPFLCNLDLAA